MNTPRDTVEAEREVLRAFRAAHPRHEPFTGPVLIRFTAVFAVPPSWPEKLKAAARTGTLYCVKKPDKDNIEKLIVDALSPPKRKPDEPVAPSPKGYAWVDDQQVMGGGVKRYGYPPRVDVVLESLEHPDMPATPGQRRLEARAEAGGGHPAPSPPRRNLTKSGTAKHPPALRRAIRAALAKEERQRGR